MNPFRVKKTKRKEKRGVASLCLTGSNHVDAESVNNNPPLVEEG